MCKILTQNVLKQQILADSIVNLRVRMNKILNYTIFPLRFQVREGQAKVINMHPLNFPDLNSYPT